MRLWLLRHLAALPLPLIHGFAFLLGWLLYLIPNKQRHISRINVELCFPQLTPSQRRRLIRSSLIELAKTFLESFKLWLDKAETILALATAVSGEDHVKQALNKGKGVILLVPHLGNWEYVGLYCSHHYPMTSLYRPQRSVFMDRLILHGRERLGARLVPSSNEGVRTIFAALKNDELVGILPDQNPGAGKGVFVPFFGIQANTPVLPARLAQRTGATVLCAYAERLAYGEGFHLHFVETDPGMSECKLEIAAQCMNEDLEKVIRNKPEQYWWSHNRFRHRPPGENEIY